MAGFDEEMEDAMEGLSEEDLRGDDETPELDDDGGEAPTADDLVDVDLDEEDEEEEQPAPKAKAPAADPRDEHIRNLHAALSQARGEKRMARERAQALERRQQLTDRRHAIILQRVAEASGVDLSDVLPAAAAPVPDQAADPIGHILGRVSEMLAPLTTRLEEQEKRQGERELDGQVAAVDRYVAEDTAAFAADHPDYDAAEEVVLEAMAGDAWARAKEAYPTADEDDLAAHVEQFIARAIGNLKVGAYRDGKSLASIVYAVAQKKGWKPNGKAAAPRRRRPAGGKVGELQRNLERTATPPAAGLERAPRKGGPLSLATVEGMSDEEFYELTKDPKTFERLLAAVSR